MTKFGYTALNKSKRLEKEHFKPPLEEKVMSKAIGHGKIYSEAPDMHRMEMRKTQNRHRSKNKPSMPKMPWDDK